MGDDFRTSPGFPGVVCVQVFPIGNSAICFGKSEKGRYIFNNLRTHADSIAASSMQQEYLYDVFGPRVARTVYENNNAHTTDFAYDGDRIIDEPGV